MYVSADFDPRSLGRLYITLIQGSMVMEKASRSPAIIEENVEHLRIYIEALFGKRRSSRK